ncbi:MAG: cadmium-translocating P-type ATPase [Clostridia bacterium]|nr:cadmium-translocating P-type ATPase [Clostridia bacterium]
MTGKQKRTSARILLSAILFGTAIILPLQGNARLIVFILPYLIIGADVLWHALSGIAHAQIFDENFLMALATIGALCIGEYPEAVAVMLFYQVGEFFQDYAVNRSRQSIAALMDICPDSANLEKDGELFSVLPDAVNVGDIIVVKPGERIPLDGSIVTGSSSLNTAALTGEPLPRPVSAGDEVFSGSINETGLLRIQVSRPFADSTVSRILELVENASANKAKAEHFITRFARWYTPCVVGAALLVALIPPLCLRGDWQKWLYQALTFLVVSCPCALVISIPLSFFGGIGGASRRGILVKGGNYLEALADAETVVFDKTGTLTSGNFRVTEICPLLDITARDLLTYAALAEIYSDHPIARSLRDAAGELDRTRVDTVHEEAGLGVRAMVDGTPVAAGSRQLMDALCLTVDSFSENGSTAVHVAIDNQYAGYIIIADEPKPHTADTIAALRRLGIRRTVMLTGDRPARAAQIAASLGLDDYRAELLPHDKVACIESLLTEQTGGRLIFVGDGINDAPALSRADIGIAMGGLGTDAAIEAADLVIMDDSIAKVAEAIAIARRTRRIVRQNIIFALSVKGLVLLAGLVGAANMWFAVFADVGVALLAVVNAMRCLHTGHPASVEQKS